jgi:iron complex transport system permease protein
MRPRFALFLLIAVAVVGLLALVTGSEGVQIAKGLSALSGSGDPLQRDIILELRLPRTLLAFGCGALLAIAGTLLQALLRNPLADPFVLGISGGAGAATLLAMLLGAGGVLTVVFGLVGAAGSLALLLGMAWRGGLLPTRLLLAGVMLSATWGALITLMLALAPDAPLRGMLFWLMGDFAASGLRLALGIAGAALAMSILVLPLAASLDALQRGELGAAALGVRIGLLRLVSLLLAAVATTVVVLAAGGIGFVGLVVPHLLRSAGVRGHRALLPAAALSGGGLLVLADVLARSVVAPLQLPVGALTALIGAPTFLWLLTRTALGR